MRPFDLVLTPGWQWHDHGNTTSQPMIWLDGLDVPTVLLFDASFAEHWPTSAHPQTVPAGDTALRYGRNLRPLRGSTADRRPAHQPLFHYPYAEWRESLQALARAGDPDPHFGHALEFTNPADGGVVMPTISAHVRLLPAGFATRPRAATDGTIYVVVEGKGSARVDGRPASMAGRCRWRRAIPLLSHLGGRRCSRPMTIWCCSAIPTEQPSRSWGCSGNSCGSRTRFLWMAALISATGSPPAGDARWQGPRYAAAAAGPTTGCGERCRIDPDQAAATEAKATTPVGHNPNCL